MAEVDDLFKKYSTTPDNPVTPVDTKSASGVDDLFNKYSTSPDVDTNVSIPPEAVGTTIKIGRGIKQGLKDVVTTVGNVAVGGGRLAEKLGVPTSVAVDPNIEADLSRLKAERQTFEQENPELSASTGRFLGQTAATLPLLPVKAIQGINVGMRALPTISATGEKIAAPILNRLGASVATGAVGGGIFGAATSGANEEGIAANTATGLITGALAGPVITAAGIGANKAITKAVDVWKNININKLVNQTGMPASAVKNIIGRLEDAGFTPVTAQAELDRLGPKATLADLSDSLTTEASGLASMGEKPTSILKGRFAARAGQAGDETQRIVNQQLGPHLDLDTEKANIVKGAQTATGSDYKAAHASNQVLDAQPIVDDIDKSLQTAVGSKKNALAEAKSYLYRTFKKPDGTDETIPRFNINDLHETRIGLDGLLSKLKQEGNSQESATYRAVNDVRGQIDDLLKQNPEMKAADEKFAGEMKKKDALQAGYDVLKKNLTKEQFATQFTNQSPELQDAMRKGMRAYIGDYLEKGSQGEANAAQRLFSKKESNRNNLELAFGNKATEALDALEREEAFRTTEKAVRFGSQTAERLAVQKRYGEQSQSGGVLGQAFKGMVLDLATGAPAVATVGYGAKRAGHNALVKLSEDRLGQLAEGSADILSRSGNQAKNALDVMQRVERVQSRVRSAQKYIPQLPTLKLPAAFGGPVGETTYEKYGK